MADENDALLKLAVDDSELLAQFEKIDGILNKLGSGASPAMLASSFDKLITS